MRISCRISWISVLGLVVLLAASGNAQQPQPCPEPTPQHEEKIVSLWENLIKAYSVDDKKQEEALNRQLEGYVSHRDVTFTDDETNKMEELAQRPEVKMIIEAIYTEGRAHEVELAHSLNLLPCSFYYPNPWLQDYVSKLGQSLV